MMSNNINVLDNPSDIRIDNNRYMLEHIGGKKKLDNDNDYVNKQKYIIEENNANMYEFKQHDINYDIKEQEFNIVQQRHSLGINMLSTHGDKGYDYRDFPNENDIKNKNYNPYIGYLHKNGLIGKNKKQYITNYISIDSRNRLVQPSTSIKQSILLDNNPLFFLGNELKINMKNTYDLKINDKISINGIIEREEVFRTIINDIDNTDTSTFEFINNNQYVIVHAPLNMDISSESIHIMDRLYGNINVILSNFKGDTKTEWLFNIKQYEYNINSINDTNNYVIELTENVNAVTIVNGEYIPTTMKIISFTIDDMGNVLSIGEFPEQNTSLLWLDVFGNNPINIPVEYMTEVSEILTKLNIEPLTYPNTIYNVMEYIQNIQNITRPIFYNYMKNIDNFNSDIYIQNVNIIMSNYTSIQEIQLYGNISLNELNKFHNIYLTENDILDELNIPNNDDNKININKFYFKLNIPYENNKILIENPLNSNMLKVTTFKHTISDVSIVYNHYGGVPISDMSADYPIDITRNTGYRYIKNVIKNKYISIELDKKGLYNGYFGGDCISIGVINNITQNSYNSNKYNFAFGKLYTNIAMIKMIGSAFPKTHKLIYDGSNGYQKNNCLYWQNLDDGDTIYKIEIDKGIYDKEQLKLEIENKIQLTERNKNNIDINKKNKIIVDINELTDTITFTSYNIYMPDGVSYIDNIVPIYEPVISIEKITNINESKIEDIDINDKWYYYPYGDYFTNFPNVENICSCIRVRIYHKNHKLNIKDKIIIENSIDVGVIPKSYVNTEHIITQVIDNNIYDIVITNINFIPDVEFKTVPDTKGGYNCTIYSLLKFRLRFDYEDTFGTIIGFINAGNELSITPYNTVITNKTKYENEIIDNNISYNNTSINLSTPEYLIIKCKELHNIKSNGIIKDYFYKIYLTSDNNRYSYNTYVDTPIFYNQPLRKLIGISFEFYTPQGEFYDFNNLPYSFDLEIISYSEIPIGTNIISN